ncbi:purine and uridine phosphorylase [Aulographum hederae CBS 113979]|uniref:Purine and uridine phosphorylase n=1 Tax=Aulographum hederae CBS 113979 TaxID=1176131 RepID=A0A6G1HCQ8_9PEZI|nr:purine and uridine phosphorylase [Aulographum hederae CBS 113979]
MSKRKRRDDHEAGSNPKKLKMDSGNVQTPAVEMTKKRKMTHNDYTVGWICPLEVEQIAALEMLDEQHERLHQAPTDHNVYNLGMIAGHNVVIAALHQPGNNPAATVVTQMRMTFPNLRFGLLVGIGGGVPVKTDNGMIRLGDIVVSKPSGEHSGAVQYDHGKAKNGQFERIGALAPPPAVLLNAAQDLAVKRARSRQDPLEDNIKRIDTSIRGLRRYRHPGVAKDYLFKPHYSHLELGQSCDECGCDPLQRIQRPTNDEDDEPCIVVHRGTIASGELVVKNAGRRDELANEYGLLCFEMEAAGVLADFPCIVIRGISDYCDTHKNDQWHGYAAAVAAAYARELFAHMPIEEVKRYISETAEKIIHRMNRRQEDGDYKEVLEWLSPTDFPAQQHDIISRRQAGTAQWFLDSAEFKKWLSGADKTLFCPGIPGAGKTIMAAVAIDDLYRTHGDDTGIAFLFCNYKAQLDQSTPKLQAALLKQLVQGRPDLAALVERMYTKHLKRQSRPSIDELIQGLRSTCSSYTTVYIIIDALDECLKEDREYLIDVLRDLQASRNVRLMYTSRFIPNITHTFQSVLQIEVRASEEDIRRFVAGQIPRLPKCIKGDKELRHTVQTQIVEAVNGMFLLARLHVDSLLGHSSTKKNVLSKLKTFKSGENALDLAYSDALNRIDGQPDEDRKLARRALSWITYAQRLLTTEELCHALAIESQTSFLDPNNINDIEDIISVCTGLVTIDEESKIIRLVHYTTQEYFERVRLKWNPSAQEEIAIACLTYISFDRFQSGSSRSDRSFEQRLAKNRFLDYSARYWSEHVRPVQQATTVSNLALAFLRNDRKVDSVIQAATISDSYKHDQYSRYFPGRTSGMHLTAINDRVDLEDSRDQRPLYMASNGGHETVVELLLAKGADVNAQGGPTATRSRRRRSEATRRSSSCCWPKAP